MKIHTKAVHAGDRKPRGDFVPVTTPIYAAASYFYERLEKLDRVLGREEEGYCYARYGNPTNAALEELVAALENGAGALACSSGMTAIQTALMAALVDRPKRVLAAEALYGATVTLLTSILEPLGVQTRFVDACDLNAVQRAIAEHRPGCLLVETISNPLLRVAPVDRLADLAHGAGACVIVDNTFATPLLVRPLELGADFVVHSATKYLAGHGDVLGGLVVTSGEHLEIVRTLARACGPALGPFESYLTMRGIKTFPLRMERQCHNARVIAQWLEAHPRIERVHFPANAHHPDRSTVARLLPEGLYGGIVSFEIRHAGRDEVFAFMDRLRLIVRATSLGDVHSMILYPAISSHRELSPKQRERMGIRDNLLRLSVGIEAVEDILEDLEQALAGIQG